MWLNMAKAKTRFRYANNPDNAVADCCIPSPNLDEPRTIPVLDVNLPYFWSHGRMVLTSWFVPLGLLVRHLVLRRPTNAPLRTCLAANVTMGVASWLFVVGFPIAIAAQILVHSLILDRIPSGNAAPYSWISVLLLSALIAAAAELGALRIFFKQKLPRPARGLLFVGDLCCVGIAAYATARYVLAHPPAA